MYSPKIREEFIHKLFQIKEKTGKPMTKQVNEAVKEYIAKFESNKDSREDNPFVKEEKEDEVSNV